MLDTSIVSPAAGVAALREHVIRLLNSPSVRTQPMSGPRNLWEQIRQYRRSREPRRLWERIAEWDTVFQVAFIAAMFLYVLVEALFHR